MITAVRIILLAIVIIATIVILLLLTVTGRKFLNQKGIQRIFVKIFGLVRFFLLVAFWTGLLVVLPCGFYLWTRGGGTVWDSFTKVLRIIIGTYDNGAENLKFSETVILIYGRLLVTYYIITRGIESYTSSSNPIYLSSVMLLNDKNAVQKWVTNEINKEKENGKYVENNHDDFKNVKDEAPDYYLLLRYWIMLPRENFLFDPKISVRLVENDHRDIEGENNYYKEQFNNDPNLKPNIRRTGIHASYDVIRGIRTLRIELEKQDYDYIKGLVERTKEKQDVANKEEKISYSILVTIRGTDKRGRIYQRSKAYSLNQIYRNARYARVEINRKALTPTKDKDLNRKDFKSYFKYQNFNKLILLGNDENTYEDIIEQNEKSRRKMSYVSFINFKDRALETERNRHIVWLINSICWAFFNSRGPINYIRDSVDIHNGVDTK